MVVKEENKESTHLQILQLLIWLCQFVKSVKKKYNVIKEDRLIVFFLYAI